MGRRCPFGKATLVFNTDGTFFKYHAGARTTWKWALAGTRIKVTDPDNPNNFCVDGNVTNGGQNIDYDGALFTRKPN